MVSKKDFSKLISSLTPSQRQQLINQLSKANKPIKKSIPLIKEKEPTIFEKEFKILKTKSANYYDTVSGVEFKIKKYRNEEFLFATKDKRFLGSIKYKTKNFDSRISNLLKRINRKDNELRPSYKNFKTITNSHLRESQNGLVKNIELKPLTELSPKARKFQLRAMFKFKNKNGEIKTLENKYGYSKIHENNTSGLVEAVKEAKNHFLAVNEKISEPSDYRRLQENAIYQSNTMEIFEYY